MKIVYGLVWFIMKAFLLTVMILLAPLYLIAIIWEGIAKELKDEQMMRDFNDNWYF